MSFLLKERFPVPEIPARHLKNVGGEERPAPCPPLGHWAVCWLPFLCPVTLPSAVSFDCFPGGRRDGNHAGFGAKRWGSSCFMRLAPSTSSTGGGQPSLVFWMLSPLILRHPSDPGLASQARGMELVVCVIVCSLPSPNPTSRPSELSTKGFKAGNDHFA